MEADRKLPFGYGIWLPRTSVANEYTNEEFSVIGPKQTDRIP
jgi:hypothetical protein